MRLIDADVLKLELQKYQIESLIEHSEEKNVFDVINEQPTAYDREKVVAEINNSENWCNAEMIYPEVAIEIIRKGGAK